MRRVLEREVLGVVLGGGFLCNRGGNSWNEDVHEARVLGFRAVGLDI